MACGEPLVTTIDGIYRILENELTGFFFIQYKKWFRWKFYTKREGHFKIACSYKSIEEAREALKTIIENDKIRRFKGYKIHKGE